MNKADKFVLAMLGVLFLSAIAYAGWRESYSELTDHLAYNDGILVQDVSDTSMAATGTTKYIQAYNLYKYDIVHKTANYTVLTTDVGRTFTNTGATDTIVFTLPECTSATEGINYAFMVTGYYQVTIDPHANDSISDISDGEAGEYVYNDIKGSAIKLVCIQETMDGSEADAYNWSTMGYVGTWLTED
jgi:hypothetical protein